MKQTTIKSPNRPRANVNTIFLAGSIDQGNAEMWQDEITNMVYQSPCTVLNPRRDDWDSTWREDINDPNFFEQVSWELDMMHNANLVVFYFDPLTQSPVTLMELGLMASSGKCLVCCSQGYWKKGNVDILCQRFDIPLFENKETLVVAIKNVMYNQGW